MSGPDRTCDRIEPLLTGYAAGELEADERDAVARHLAGCGACRDELARERALRETLAGLPRLRCPDRVSDAILAEVDRDEARVVRGVRFRGRRSAAGLVAAAAVLALLVFAPGRDGEAPPPGAAWTETEIAAARAEARVGLALAARIIERTELETMDDVFGRRLPEAVDASVKTLTDRLEGGQG